jgi:hypothetical protein
MVKKIIEDKINSPCPDANIWLLLDHDSFCNCKFPTFSQLVQILLLVIFLCIDPYEEIQSQSFLPSLCRLLVIPKASTQMLCMAMKSPLIYID